MAACESPVRACNTVAAITRTHTGGAVDILLSGGGQLALTACSGAWQAPAAMAPHHGIMGQVLGTGRPVAVADASSAYAGLHPGRPVGAVICAPLTSRSQPPFGVLNVEFDQPVDDLSTWLRHVAAAADKLGRRIAELGGPPAQSRAELLLRHTLGFAAVRDSPQLAGATCRAAVELTGLASAMILVRRRDARTQRREPHVKAHTAAQARNLPAHIAGLPARLLSPMIDRVCRYGASQTMGDPGHLDARGFEPLIDVGVRTLVAIPVHGTAADPHLEAALLVADELAVRVQAKTVNLLQLMVAHAVVCHDRLTAMRRCTRPKATTTRPYTSARQPTYPRARREHDKSGERHEAQAGRLSRCPPRRTDRQGRQNRPQRRVQRRGRVREVMNHRVSTRSSSR